jgi:hypothetical protein
MNKLSFFDWLIKVKYALVAIGSCKDSNYGVLYIKLDKASWKPLWENGLTPIEAVLESECN